MSYYMPKQGVGKISMSRRAFSLGNSRFQRRSFSGFGASFTFDPGTTWSNWAAGGADGDQAAKDVQAALNEIGYGPLVVDGQFGAGSVAAWTRFVNDNPPLTGTWPDQPGIDKLAEKLNQGGNQGGGGVILEHTDGGVIVSGADPNALFGGKLSRNAMIGIGAAVLLGIGALALMSKKKTSTTTSTGKPVLPSVKAA